MSERDNFRGEDESWSYVMGPRHHNAIHELYEIVEKQAEQIKELREDRRTLLIEAIDHREQLHAQRYVLERLESLERSREYQRKWNKAIAVAIGFEQHEIDDLVDAIYGKQKHFPSTLRLVITASKENSQMTITPLFGFADGKPIDATHSIGTPTFLWTTSGTGVIEDPAAAVCVITPADPENTDDVVTLVASNVFAGTGNPTQTLTASVDLADGVTILGPNSLGLTVSA